MPLNHCKSIVFKIEEGYDLVKFRDGNSTDAKYLGINSGYVLPPNVTSSGNQMLVSFYTSYDGQLYPGGYYALVHENPHYCEQWLDWEARSIRSPTFPDKKTKSRSCLWLLTANEGYTITVNVERFEVPLLLKGMHAYEDLFF